MEDIKTYTLVKSEIPLISDYTGKSYGTLRSIYYNGQILFVANDLASIMGYNRPNNAVRDHTSPENQFILYINELNIVNKPDSWKYMSHIKFINTAGVFELINNSKMSYAKELRKIISSKVLPGRWFGYSSRKTQHKRLCCQLRNSSKFNIQNNEKTS